MRQDPTSMRRTSFARACVAMVVASAFALGAAAQPTPAAASNALQITVGNGPVAGAYPLPASRVLCVSTTNGLAASFKSFVVHHENKPGVTMRVRDAKTISEAQLIVDNPTDHGTKRGSLELTFGNRGEHPTKYLLFVPGGGTLTQTQAGSGVAFAFTGRTKDGILLHADAVCQDTMKL